MLRLVFALLALALPLHSNQVRNFWFAGAEINRYELSQMRYGESHPGHAEFIFVTEPFLTKPHVKNEYGGQPSTDVLKLNALRTFNTGIYSYRTMTSTFQPIDLDTYPRGSLLRRRIRSRRFRGPRQTTACGRCSDFLHPRCFCTR